MAITGGPFKTLRWASLDLHPTDSPAEYEESGTDFEGKKSPDGFIYRNGKPVIGFIKQECVFTAAQAKAFKAKKNGIDYPGTGTMESGEVIEIVGGLEGAHEIVDGKCTVFITGNTRLQ